MVLSTSQGQKMSHSVVTVYWDTVAIGTVQTQLTHSLTPPLGPLCALPPPPTISCVDGRERGVLNLIVKTLLLSLIRILDDYIAIYCATYEER